MIQWRWKKFEELTGREVFEIARLRQNVFVVSQNCVYPDLDDADLKSLHLCGWREQELVAYSRVLSAGMKYAEPAIGRVATSLGARGLGFGRAMMVEAIQKIQKEWGPVGIRISAQAYLEKFYGELGFKIVSPSYLEDQIPHFEMLYLPKPS